MTRVLIVSFVAAVAGACGTAVPETELSTLQVAWHAPLIDCTARASLSSMTAALVIGGYQTDCVLDVDPISLEASGHCPDIAVGIERPLMVIYSLADPLDAGTVVPLALLVGSVDLRPESISSEHLSVDLVADGTHALLLIDAAALAALPGPSTPDDDLPLFAARQWAQAQLEARGATLDCDSDAAGNLVEACASTLYSDMVPSCHVP